MPAIKCNSLSGSYTFSNATWTTNDSLASSTYCYKKNGNLYPHITIVNTGGGTNDFKKFHITMNVDGTEVKINYFYNIGNGSLQCDGLNNTSFPSHIKQAITAQLGDLSDATNAWHQIAVAFCNATGATVTGSVTLNNAPDLS